MEEGKKTVCVIDTEKGVSAAVKYALGKKYNYMDEAELSTLNADAVNALTIKKLEELKNNPTRPRPGLIILDYDIRENIMEKAAGLGIPIFLISKHKLTEENTLGAVDYLRKPFNTADFITKVEDILPPSRSNKESMER